MSIQRPIWLICVCVVLALGESALDPAFAMQGIPPPNGGGGNNNLTQAVENGTLGGFYGAFKTAIIDDSFSFIDTLLGHGTASSGGSATTSAPLGYAAVATRTPMIDRAMASGEIGAPSRFDGWGPWAAGSFDRARYSGGAANPGLRGSSYSGIAAIDRVAGNWMFGVAAGTGRTNLTQDTTDDVGHANALRVGTYVSYRPNAWTVTAAFAYGWQTIDASRQGETASFNARSLSAGVEAARAYSIRAMTIQPLAGAVYTQLNSDGFVESGGTGLEAVADAANSQSLRSYLGMRAFSDLPVGASIVTPEVHARVLQDFLSMQRNVTGSFVADPTATFTAAGLQPARTAMRLGASIEARSGQTWRVALSYDAEARGADFSKMVRAVIRAIW